MPAADVIALVRALKAPFGLERSVKISHGVLADERYLLSVGRGAFGRDAADRLIHIGRSLQLPADFARDLPSALEGADVIHFGYEAAGGRDVYKIYCEYAARTRQAMASPSRSPVLVHRAYKWVPERPDSATVTRYTWLPYEKRAGLEQKLHELVPPGEAPRAHRCALALVARIAPLAEAGEALLMEVEEPGNPRRSCDLNVYDAALRMRQIADLIETTAADFAIPAAQTEAVFGGAAERMVGHLSAGRARDGAEFVTVYFGVEAH
jgi:tryptophan 7-halogenase